MTRLRNWARSLKSEVVALWLCTRQPRPRSRLGAALIIAAWVAALILVL